MRYVCRFVSIYITRFLIPLGISANQVSLLMIITGLLASCFFLSSSAVLFLLGALLLQLWYLLDNVDGEVARYRHFQKTGSMVIDKKDSLLEGMYYDMINHYIVNLLVPATIGFGLFRLSGSEFYILLGLLGGLAQVLMLAMFDARYRTIWFHLKKYHSVQIVKTENKSENSAEDDPKIQNVWKYGFMAMHYTVTYPTVMNLVIIAALFNFIFPIGEWRIGLLWYLTVASILVTGTLISRTILNRTLTAEFRRDFIPSDHA